MWRNLNLSELVNGFRFNQIDLRYYIDATLNIIDSQEPVIHALLPESKRRQRLHKAVDELYIKYPDPAFSPPLFGVLVGVKDLFNAKGLPTQAGSKLPPEAFIGSEAPIVAKLKELGAIVLGKTVSTEFAYFSPGETCNPKNPLHTPGGSSSGSAAAVAAGYCPIALGTQTIASVIRPASYCGVYGYKPSYGLVSTSGVFPFSQTADHVGFFAQSIASLSFLAQTLSFSQTPSQLPPKISLGVVQGTYLYQASEPARANYERTVKLLRDKGYQFIELDPFGDIEPLNTAHKRLIAAEFAQNHKQLYKQYSHLYSRHSKELYELGLTVSDVELLSLREAAQHLRKKLSKLMQQYNIDLWLTPATTTTAPLGLASTGSPLMSLPWTNAGLPSLTIPSGLDDNALPFGLQLIADFSCDASLLKLASPIQDAISPDSL